MSGSACQRVIERLPSFEQTAQEIYGRTAHEFDDVNRIRTAWK